MGDEHYFTRRPTSPNRPRELSMDVRGAGRLRLWTDRGVFSYRRIDPGTRLLVESFQPGRARRVVDVGAGYGAVGLALALRFPELQVVLVEINERAVRLCEANIRANRLANARCLVADGLSALRSGSVGAVVTNPPVRAGRQLLLSWLEAAERVLEPGGSLWLVIRTRQGAASLFRWMEGRFYAADVVSRGGGYRVLRAVPRPLPGADR